MLCRGFITLTTREERYARHSSRDSIFEDFDCPLSDFLHVWLLGAFFACDNHIRFKDNALKLDALLIKLRKERVKRCFCHFVAALNRMVSAHENFRFNDRDNTGFLAKRGITAKRVIISFDAANCRCAANILLWMRNFDYSAPFSKTCAKFVIFREALAQSV